MLHLPILRQGRPYRSVDLAVVRHHRTGEPFVEVSLANAGLIRRDLLRHHEARAALAAIPVSRLIAMAREAGSRFLEATLPLDPLTGTTQGPDDYVAQVSATTGLPHALVRANMGKIAGVMTEMEAVLSGLTRGLDLSILDAGAGEQGGRTLSFFPRGSSLGVVLPNNSPGVHSLWVPAIPLKTPVVLKPGSAELWTPYRIAQAFLASGCPPEAFSIYPAEHAAGAEILRHAGRALVFGDASTTAPWRRDPRVEVHGPGFSKIVVGSDCIERWPELVDVMVTSIVDNGGRSCVNASGVWVTGEADAIAEALARRLAAVTPRPAEDPEAALAPFVDPSVAARIDALIESGLAQGGAEDVTARFRHGPRLARVDGLSYLLPTIVRCDSPDHPLANREFLFPFASIVEVREDAIPDALGPSLVVTALTADRRLIDRLIASPLVDRLNVGPIPTNRIGWDQPHEGNLFEHLYARRAFQRPA